MKTMWFTFLYASAIPLGALWSMLGLCIYYFADKYNVIHRRSIAENLSNQLSNEMIENLEFVMIFHCVNLFLLYFFKYFIVRSFLL